MNNHCEMEDKTEGLLKLIGKDLKAILDLRTEALKNDKEPVTLRIPRCKFLGMELEFANISQPEVVTR